MMVSPPVYSKIMTNISMTAARARNPTMILILGLILASLHKEGFRLLLIRINNLMGVVPERSRWLIQRKNL